jgi:hypothetical protein
MSVESVIIPFPARGASAAWPGRASNAAAGCNVRPFPVRASRSPARIAAPESSRLQGALTAMGLLLPIWAPLAFALWRR